MSNSVISTLKTWLYRTVPNTYFMLRDLYQSIKLKTTGELKRIQNKSEQLTTDDTIFDFARQFIFPCQLKSEILALIEFLNQKQPGIYLEIGTANGGTHYLIRRLCPTIQKSIGIDIDVKNKSLIDRITSTRSAHYIIGESGTLKTIQRVESILGSDEKLDVLFLDGDHSYEGVSGDFSLYNKYVRRGGIIIFHDIVQDHGQRFGKQTNKYTGDVPRFYAEIKEDYEHYEFIEEPDQDGFGIGVIVTS